MIINLTGQAGAGKTSIAKELCKSIPKSINIDGDELRDVFKNKDYSETGRRNNINNAYNIALFLEAKGFVPIISLISPYKDLRDELKDKTKVLEFYIFTSEIRGREKFFADNYQKPIERFLLIDTTQKKAEDLANQILTIIENDILNNIFS
ncbi:MAG: adenylyl-sulfate kinase [Micavibrio sp.]|nr:adenylyl-sulfate kinase [Micavibrio sp.]